MSAPLWALVDVDPEAVAVEEVGTGRAVTWSALDRLTTQFGHGLVDVGAGPGAHVTLVAGNRLEVLVAMLGAWRAGCVYTPLKTGWTAREIDQVLDDAGTAVVVTDRPAAREAAEARGLPVIDLDSPSHATWLAQQRTEAMPADRCGWKLTYTSGTTGRPKGVVPAGAGTVAFAAAWAGVARYADVLSLPGEGVHLFVSQLFHGAPQTFGIGALARGARLRILPRWDPAVALTELSDPAVTSTIMVPTMFRQLLALPGVDRSRPPGALVTLLHGGEPAPIPIKAAMLDWFGPVLVEYYGFTEGGLTVASAQDWQRRPGTVGKPGPGLSVRIVDDRGQPVPNGTDGLITFVPAEAGRQFRYLRDPDKTTAVTLGQGFGVGDIGRLDEDGYLFVSGRTADVVVTGGVNVYPAEVEDALADVPGVADVCAVGGPDPERGEVVVLHVVLSPAADEAAVRAALVAAAGERLAAYKHPRRTIIVAELPRDQTGKVLRRVLREPLWAAS